MRFLKPLDEHLLHQVFKRHSTIITIEDGTIQGGLGSAVLAFASKNSYPNKVEVLGIPDTFIPHVVLMNFKKELGWMLTIYPKDLII